MRLHEVIQTLSRIKMFSKAAAALKNRTESQWLQCETDLYNRKRAEEENQGNSQWILHAFDWLKSPEDSDFWAKVHDGLEEREYDLQQKALKLNPSTLAMTKQCPTKPGYYWWQQRKKSKRFIVKVFREGGLFGLPLKEEDEEPLDDGDMSFMPIETVPGYWSNHPIETPKIYI